MFANSTGDWSSIPGRVISKTQKWYLMLLCLTLSIKRYGSRVKWSNLGKRKASSPTPRCSSHWKRSFRVALDYGHQLYFYIYIYFCSHWYTAGPLIYIYMYKNIKISLYNESICHVPRKNWCCFYSKSTSFEKNLKLSKQPFFFITDDDLRTKLVQKN